MGNKLKIKVSCGACGGTGQQPVGIQGTQLCLQCDGSGEQTIAELYAKDILDKLDEILEKLNA